ncbi:SemiSWEET transporter [Actinoplanes sp. M2I2]|uniref:SemiSWEET transporter n=1 Tax=Actinoplanes sp. M2I2 TaxID=1734444 RepID=UPI0020209696|nr:SemiSWEET transporter [Actinoplanes sp. M2I2]
MLTHALGLVAAALSVSLSWPQVYKSCVQRRTNGLSATACSLGVAMPLGWITYGLLAGQRIQVLTNVATGLTGLAILIALLATQPRLRTRAALRVSAGSAGGVITAALISLGLAALPGVSGHTAAGLLGTLLAAVSFVSAVPQPLALLRDRHQDLSGLSPLRWRMAAAACASWMAYGILTGQPAVWASSSVGLVSAAIVCVVLHVRRERAVVEHSWISEHAWVPEHTWVTRPVWRDTVTTRNLAMAGV